MGLYIQCGQNKVRWCTENGRVLNGSSEARQYMENPEAGSLVVCVVDNIAFQAAAVMYSVREFEEWAAPDNRKRYWFLMRVAAIRDFCPEWGNYIKESP